MKNKRYEIRGLDYDDNGDNCQLFACIVNATNIQSARDRASIQRRKMARHHIKIFSCERLEPDNCRERAGGMAFDARWFEEECNA